MNSPFLDHILAAIELMSAAARFDHGDAAPQRTVELHQAQQDDVVHDRADGEIRHKARDAEEFRIFVIEKSRHQARLAVRHQRVKEIPVQRQIAQSGAVTRHAVDHQPLDFVLLDQLDNPGKVRVDFQFLRALEQDVDFIRLDELLKVETKGSGIA